MVGAGRSNPNHGHRAYLTRHPNRAQYALSEIPAIDAVPKHPRALIDDKAPPDRRPKEQIMTQITSQTSPVDELDATLTALDRCDSCGAQAYIRVTLASGELLFCAHHGAKFKDKLEPTALYWHDETARLHNQPVD
jgi:hypothetical protein